MAIDVFAEKCAAKCPKVVECLTQDRETLLAFYDFPAEHWNYLRTSNQIESLTSAQFSGRTRFERSEGETGQSDEGPVLLAGVQVRATILDHGEVVLAFALEERAYINVWRNKVEAMGLSIGPWLRAFKEASLRGAPDNTLIDVAWRDRHSGNPASLPLSHLKKKIMKITVGRKFAYVVDCSFTDANVEKIARLAKDADVLLSKRHSSKLAQPSPRRVTI